MRSRHTSLSEQLEAQGVKIELHLPEIFPEKGFVEPGIDHVEDISPEEENAILGTIELMKYQKWSINAGYIIYGPFNMTYWR